MAMGGVMGRTVAVEQRMMPYLTQHTLDSCIIHTFSGSTLVNKNRMPIKANRCLIRTPFKFIIDTHFLQLRNIQ